MTIESQRSRIAQAQAEKKVLLERGGTVLMDYQTAALAFGMSVERLRTMNRLGECLILSPAEGCVKIQLSDICDFRRNLWDELIETLSVGQKEASKSRQSYERLYILIQAARHEHPEGDEIIEAGKRILTQLFDLMPFGMQMEVTKNGMALGMVDQQILGSPADFT